MGVIGVFGVERVNESRVDDGEARVARGVCTTLSKKRGIHKKKKCDNGCRGEFGQKLSAS